MKTCTVRNVLLFKVYPIQCHFHGWHIFIKCAYDASMRRLIFILNIGWGELRNIFWNFTIYVNFRNWNFQLGEWDCGPPDPPRQDRHMHVPTMKNIFLCPWKENILHWWRLELFFLNNLLCHEECFFPDFSIEHVYC